MNTEIPGYNAQPAVNPHAAPMENADALYQESLVHFQNGQWQEAIAGFEQVLQLVPDHSEAKTFLEEARLKASLDQVKPKPKRFVIPRIVKRLLLVAVSLAVILALIVGVRWAYGRYVEPRKAQQQVELQRAQQLQQAQKYLAERDYSAAEEAFRALLAQDPNNVEAQQGLAEAQKKLALAKSYTQAQQAIARKDWNEASRILAAIIEQDPSYRDVKSLQTSVQNQQHLSDYFNEAETAYNAGDWQKAIASYEALRNIDLDYESQTVTEHLFESYLKQGMALVASVQGSDDAIRQAQSMFKKALALKPQQPQAMQELALADKYIEGQTRMAQGDTAGAIAAWDWVYKQNPDYASGKVAALLKAASGQGTPAVTPAATPLTGTPAALPTVTPGPAVTEANFQQQYDGLMQKGDAALNAGDYAQAEEAYRQATIAGVHGGYNVARWLFTAYAKAGTAAARRGDYAAGLELVQTAIHIMTRSAVALPSETYASFVAEGDRYAQQQDYRNAFAQYSKALQVMGAKCGLENWSILP